MIIIMPETQSKISMDRDFSQVVIKSALSKHTKTVVATDVNVPIDLEIGINQEAEDHHPTMSASYAKKQVIGKQKISIWGQSVYNKEEYE